MILRVKHPQLWVQPTHFQQFVEDFKTEFSGNRTTTLIFLESTWLIKSVHFFKQKLPTEKGFADF